MLILTFIIIIITIVNANCDDAVRLAEEESPKKLIATPVRRSTRPSCAGLPSGLRDHDVVVESVKDIVPDMTTSRLVFRDNRALKLDWTTDSDANIKSLVHNTDSR